MLHPLHDDARHTIWLSLVLFAILAMTAPLRAVADDKPAATETAAAAETEAVGSDASPDAKSDCKACVCKDGKCEKGECSGECEKKREGECKDKCKEQGDCKTECKSEDKCKGECKEKGKGDCEEKCKKKCEAKKAAEKTKTAAVKARLAAVAKKVSKKTAAKKDKKGEDADEDEAEEAKKVRLASIVVSGGLPESAGGGGPFADRGTDLRQTIARLEKAAKDEKIDGVLLEIKGPALGRGRLNEFREAISRVRKSGKKVHAYLESGDSVDFLIASACDDITVPEPGDLMIPGIYLEATYFKGLLDKLGIEADFLHMGEAKGAAEPVTRTEMSPAVRANLTDMVDDLYNQMLECVASDRRIHADDVKALIDDGLISACEAAEAGLIDRVAYADELRAELTKAYDTEELVYVKNYGKKKVDTDFSGTMGLIKLMQAMMGVESSKKRSKAKKIAIVYAVGPITSGKSQSGMFGGQSMGSDTIVKALKEAADDPKVAAIVFRINSPGGSALASDMMWRQTQAIDKPIVASMSDVAASGGYYIAMGCDKIYAEPGTITGSIGVVGGKLALDGLYKKIGVSTSVISRGKNSGLFSSTRVWNESERAAIRKMMEDVYEQFTTKVAEGRHMPHERILELAGGRVYTGRDAKQIGLIDELGTLKDAVAAAKCLAGIDKDEEVDLQALPKAKSFFESLFDDNNEEEEVRAAGGVLNASIARSLPPELVNLLRKTARIRLLFRDRITLTMPYELEIR